VYLMVMLRRAADVAVSMGHSITQQ
jgi:hypothetical protein